MCVNAVEPKCALHERLVIAHIISSLNLFLTDQTPVWCKHKETLKIYIFQLSLQTETTIDSVLLNDIQAEITE